MRGVVEALAQVKRVSHARFPLDNDLASHAAKTRGGLEDTELVFGTAITLQVGPATDAMHFVRPLHHLGSAPPTLPLYRLEAAAEVRSHCCWDFRLR